ncbi:unnamed protein product [Mytilus coruscus]|uniref:Uncharacterized protein n=1 Tax=Mytilus coruscus TaxID=42192 RepID=A0A6J8CIE2_MYTCO|nr:unnamed protein product [Mytilus coruscus]
MDNNKNSCQAFCLPMLTQGEYIPSIIKTAGQLILGNGNEIRCDRTRMVEKKINADKNGHRDEKTKIIKEKGENIKLLQDKNDSLLLKTSDQAGKIIQLEVVNTEKDREIEEMKNARKIKDREIEEMKNARKIKDREIEEIKKKYEEILKRKEEDYNRENNNLSEKNGNLENQNIELEMEKEMLKKEIENKPNNHVITQRFNTLESMSVKQSKRLHHIETVLENNSPTITNATNIQINQTKSKGAIDTKKSVYNTKQPTPRLENRRRRDFSPRKPKTTIKLKSVQKKKK